MTTRKHILITAYDVNPYKGSEAATGWNYPLHISKVHDVTVVTRQNNRANIEKKIAEGSMQECKIQFLYYDLPKWARFWKRGARGSFLYFYLWQFFVSLFLFRRRYSFDVVHALNFHSDWAPSFLWILNKPFVWGPLNHNELIPRHILGNISKRTLIIDRLKWGIKLLCWNLDPFLWISRLRANIILIGHDHVRKRLHLSAKKIVLCNQIAAYAPPEINTNPDEGFKIIFAGRFIPIKGIFALIEGWSNFVNLLPIEDHHKINLEIYGDGPLKDEIEGMVSNLPHNKTISLPGWVSLEEINTIMQKSTAFSFLSYEGAGMVIAEAMSNGLPIIALNQYSNHHNMDETCSVLIECEPGQNIAQNFCDVLIQLYRNKEIQEKLSSGAMLYFEENLSWDCKAEKISKIYQELL